VKIKVPRFNRSTLPSHIYSTDLIPWVHHSREEGSLDYDGRLVRLQAYLKFNTIIHRQQSSSRKFFVLSPKMTLGRATMLHSKFSISPTWRAKCQGVRPGQIRKRATQAVVG
jgi:hypothetical protein